MKEYGTVTSLQSQNPTQSSTADEIARLKAELEALKQAQSSGCSCRVSQNGAVSLYGLGRFPVTLYANQWHRLFAAVETVKAFIVAHQSELASKGA